MKRLVILLWMSVWCAVAVAQEKPSLKIIGTVLDDLGDPMIGAIVHDKAEKEFVVTDVEGRFMLPTETEDYRSQWKLTAGEDGKVVITNRATGFQISNTSQSVGDHNLTWLTASGAPGFTVTSLGDYAFKLESVEDDGVNRCLALADRSAEAITYPEAGESTSAIGWKFFPVEIDTGIGSMQAGRTVVQVMKGRIFVKGCPEWQLFNASGEEMPRTVALPTGVYLVKMGQKSIKVLIP